MDNKQFIGLLFLIVAIGLAGILLTNQKEEKLGVRLNSYFDNPVISTSTLLYHQIPAQLLARREGRQYASLCNTSSTGSSIYLSFATSTDYSANLSMASGTMGIMVPINTCYEINETNLYVGMVIGWASTSGTGATSTISVSTLEK